MEDYEWATIYARPLPTKVPVSHSSQSRLDKWNLHPHMAAPDPRPRRRLRRGGRTFLHNKPCPRCRSHRRGSPSSCRGLRHLHPIARRRRDRPRGRGRRSSPPRLRRLGTAPPGRTARTRHRSGPGKDGRLRSRRGSRGGSDRRFATHRRARESSIADSPPIVGRARAGLRAPPEEIRTRPIPSRGAPGVTESAVEAHQSHQRSLLDALDLPRAYLANRTRGTICLGTVHARILQFTCYVQEQREGELRFGNDRLNRAVQQAEERPNRMGWKSKRILTPVLVRAKTWSRSPPEMLEYYA